MEMSHLLLTSGRVLLHAFVLSLQLQCPISTYVIISSNLLLPALGNRANSLTKRGDRSPLCKYPALLLTFSTTGPAPASLLEKTEFLHPIAEGIHAQVQLLGRL